MSDIGMRAGLSMPAGLRFIQLARPMLVGDAYCSDGDVIEVQPPAARPAAVMPVDPLLYQSRAQKLIDRKVARPHNGPATVVLGRSLRHPASPAAEPTAAVERAVNPAPRRSERATSAPQRGAL